MDKTPFIHKFSVSKDKKYVYCVNTNRFVQVSDIVYDGIDFMWERNTKIISLKLKNKYDINDIQKTLDELHRLNNKIGFASHFRPLELVMKMTEEEYNYKLHNQMNSITLNMTNACNMDCKYCCYGKLFNDRRMDSPIHMTTEIAQKSIDLLINNSTESDRINIGFYGGEPFLRFNILKDMVYYTKKNNKSNKEIYFHLTTNCSLLNNEKIKWLIDNNIGLLVSLDGPKEIHDRYRVFKNGKGTYDIIIKHLLQIKETNPDYYTKRVSFNIVTAPPKDYSKLFSFCAQNELLQTSYGIRDLNYDDKGYFKVLEKKERNFNNSEIKFLLNKYLKSGSFDKNQKVWLKSAFNNMGLRSIILRDIFFQCEDRISNPFCELGISRCFILTNGSILPCERIKQYNYLKLGNVVDGFYRAKSGSMQGFEILKNIKDLIDNGCCNCWAYRFCNRKTCIFIFYSKSGFSKRIFHKNCKAITKNFDNVFKLLISS